MGDDAVLLPGFTNTLNQALGEAPKDIGALWITSKDRGTSKRVGNALMQPSYVWTTVGYVIWPSAARTLVKLLPMDMPVDNFMAWHIKEGAVKTFSVQPACVRQANTGTLALMFLTLMTLLYGTTGALERLPCKGDF